MPPDPARTGPIQPNPVNCPGPHQIHHLLIPSSRVPGFSIDRGRQSDEAWAAASLGPQREGRRARAPEGERVEELHAASRRPNGALTDLSIALPHSLRGSEIRRSATGLERGMYFQGLGRRNWGPSKINKINTKGRRCTGKVMIGCCYLLLRAD